MKLGIAIIGTIVIFLSILQVESKKTKQVQIALESKETTTTNFFRLLVMRLIFGVAAAMGWGDSFSSFLNGALVPPGADDYDDYGGDDEFIPGLF
ncbi:uncharacterized protein LOC117173096 [Belonocnema kinseyi]|uniref:uncharacterized protein LOC117173096 n=1 Tax=Belonocnema kinseyi TaxID=2817044 RepID=UPI00143D3F6E|nr:uncharacterized protein LOC117173096 [Belonocnema kinseyi]